MQRLRAVLAVMCVLCLCTTFMVCSTQSVQADGQDQAYSQVGTSNTYAFALFFGRLSGKAAEDADMQKKWEASETFLQTYLLSHATAGAKAVVVTASSNATDALVLDTAEGLASASQSLAGGRYQQAGTAEYANRFREFTQNMQGWVPASGTNELWIAQIREPMRVTPQDEAVQNLTNLLNQNGQLIIHFLTTEVSTVSRQESMDGKRFIDDYLSIRYPDRVKKHVIVADATEQTETFVNYMEAMGRMAVALPAVSQPTMGQDDREWVLTYTHTPWDGQDDALLCLNSSVGLNLEDDAVWMLQADTSKAQVANPEETWYT